MAGRKGILGSSLAVSALIVLGCSESPTAPVNPLVGTWNMTTFSILVFNFRDSDTLSMQVGLRSDESYAINLRYLTGTYADSGQWSSNDTAIILSSARPQSAPEAVPYTLSNDTLKVTWMVPPEILKEFNSMLVTALPASISLVKK